MPRSDLVLPLSAATIVDPAATQHNTAEVDTHPKEDKSYKKQEKCNRNLPSNDAVRLFQARCNFLD